MEYISSFDVIGPNMIGPSSSHTAGVVSIALLAKHMFKSSIQSAVFTLYGSFARTYRGHGTDKALLGGTLGFSTDDIRIRDSYRLADEAGLQYQFIIDSKTKVSHPNTVDIQLNGADGQTLSIRGISVGGGKMKITRIDGIEVEFTGEFDTLIVKQQDYPGVVAHIVSCLSNQHINIAFMRLFREQKGSTAYTVVESDEPIPSSVANDIAYGEHIDKIMLISAR